MPSENTLVSSVRTMLFHLLSCGFLCFLRFCGLLLCRKEIGRQFLSAIHAEQFAVHAFDALMVTRHDLTPFLSIKKAACAVFALIFVLLPVFEELCPIRAFTVKYGTLFRCQLPGIVFKQIEDGFAVKGKFPHADCVRVINPPDMI